MFADAQCCFSGPLIADYNALLPLITCKWRQSAPPPTLQVSALVSRENQQRPVHPVSLIALVQMQSVN